MFYVITGAVIFAVGALFGAWMILAGQQSKTSRTSQKIQDAILKGLECQNKGEIK